MEKRRREGQRDSLAAYHLVAVVLLRQDAERRLDGDATAQTQDQVECGLLLDVVVGESAAVFELLAGEDETLLIGRDALLVLDLGLHILDGVGRLYFESDRLTSQSLDEYLHFRYDSIELSRRRATNDTQEHRLDWI